MTEQQLTEMLDRWFDTELYVLVQANGPNDLVCVRYATFSVTDVLHAASDRRWVIYSYDKVTHRWGEETTNM